jgi:hypothetical protein
METKRRFSILPFPQFFDGERLSLRIVVLPRNQNPLSPAIEQDDVIPDTPPFVTIPDAPPFATAALSFNAHIITGLASFPTTPSDDSLLLKTDVPTQAEELFIALGKNFDIKNLNQINKDLTLNDDSAKKALVIEPSVKKYLPESYRKAFNFTTPRTPNAVTDDSYHCAVRGAGLVAGFTPSDNWVSWGKVFAYVIRHPMLAEQVGMIYQTDFLVEAAHFPEGGWLYVDLNDASDYKEQQQADPRFIKRYAARIPTLVPGGESRQVFAPLLFPVLSPGDTPDGTYDNLFLETADYDDGFAKIVHAHQPRSRNLLEEKSDGAHPVKDAGVRLGWDDEQILIWYMRQMMPDETVTKDPNKRLDAPLGVFGYAIDVRETNNPPNPWESLNEVESKQALAIPRDKNQPDDAIVLDVFKGELPYQVYPAQLDGDPNKSYWLPMYFANWNGQCMVLPDADAASIYKTTDPLVASDSGTGITGPAQNRLNDIYEAAHIDTRLRYGNRYQFRVRLRDLSGGGVKPDAEFVNESPSSIGRCQFKRFVAPNRLRVENLSFNTDDPQSLNQLVIRRPLLGYPAAVYTTSKYADVVQSLRDASEAMLIASQTNQNAQAFGIADPDVDRVEITVEVQTLKMDNLLSVSGKENYVHLYTTRRSFPEVVDEEDYEAAFNIPIVYKNCKVLHTGEEADITSDLGLDDDIDNLEQIFLPRARLIRLTMRAVCEDKQPNNANYYGLIAAANDAGSVPNEETRNRDVRFGQIAQVTLYQPSTDESELFVDAADGEKLRGIYLQPDPPYVFDGSFITLLLGKEVENAPDMIQRLAKELDLENTGLTLIAPKGERVQFGCSHRIRHTLAPDNSSVTFSSKGDLMNHWLCCVTLTINRDWMWDALEDHSFVINRTVHFSHDADSETEEMEVGDIEVKHTASFESLDGADRDFTRLVFIDAVEPKNPRMQPSPAETKLRFPDTIDVTYSIEPNFKPNHGAAGDDDPVPLEFVLPITTMPSQVPKIASAGLALSPYTRNETYSATEPRQRFLWIEFAEPLNNPNDTYFARVLAYAPDQLISNNHPELLAAPQEPALPIDPEYTRLVTRASSNDLAGLSAMQPMEKAKDSHVHYLLPLPPGLNADADEMFGFFTYEFRVGHYRWADMDADDPDAMVWCTAQGRFGRPLRATGIQQPAPTLTCTVNRDEDKLYVTAPYAVAVFDGKNMTAIPPRTELWALLYAQVRQADNLDNRNILLDERQLDWRVRIETEQEIDWLARYEIEERKTLKTIAFRESKDELSYTKLRHLYKLKEKGKSNKDSKKYGTGIWSNDEIIQMLRLYGLPEDSPLSVLVVEVLPNITNLREHITPSDQPESKASLSGAALLLKLPALDFTVSRKLTKLLYTTTAPGTEKESTRPLSETLGHHRILRTSPLTEVPFVCCTDC